MNLNFTLTHEDGRVAKEVPIDRILAAFMSSIVHASDVLGEAGKEYKERIMAPIDALYDGATVAPHPDIDVILKRFEDLGKSMSGFDNITESASYRRGYKEAMFLAAFRIATQIDEIKNAKPGL